MEDILLKIIMREVNKRAADSVGGFYKQIFLLSVFYKQKSQQQKSKMLLMSGNAEVGMSLRILKKNTFC